MKQIIILSFHLLLAGSVFSQINPYRFKHITAQDGLSRNWVKSIFRDSTGYLWVGTADGLNRYDGISFSTYKYKSDDKYSINDNDILLIYEDKKGRLWVGTKVGLNLYDRKKDRFIPISAKINYVRSIHEYDNGLFLIGSPGGLYLFNPEDFTSRQIRYDINIENILHDRNNNFWLATYRGLLLLDTSDYSYTTIIPDKKKGPTTNYLVRALYQDSKGGIWVGTDSDGLLYMTYDKTNPRNTYFVNFSSVARNSESITEGAVYAIAEDEKGCLWIGVENGGVNLLDLNTFSGKKGSFRHLVYNQFDHEGLSDNSIHCIYKDKQNTIWIGTFGGGVSYYNGLLQKFNHFKHLPGTSNTINNNRINAIYEEDNYLWIGTEGGLNVYDKRKNTFYYYTHSYNDNHTIGSNAVWAIRRDSRNNLWIGTWSGGLNLFDERTKTFKRFLSDENNPKSLKSNNIYDIIETKDKNLWIASMLGGLNRYDYSTNSFQRYLKEYNKNSISGDWVMDIMEDSNGNLWISTTVAVDILERKTGRFVTFKHNPNDSKSISCDGALVLFEDSKKNIWIGTSNGLNFFNKANNTFRHFYQNNGLPSNNIRAIEEDNHGNLWLSTNNGISEFVNAVSLPKEPVFKNYNVSDGLQGNEFNSRASFKNKDGRIYFGGNNGYNFFNPDKIRTNPNIPNIVFAGFLLFNKPVRIGDKGSPLVNDISSTRELRLSHKDNVFTIEFASLNLLAPENNQYAFMLEGFEKEWNYVGRQHSATYTNLDPGRYTFKVKASNNDGLWNEKGISLQIVIKPAWWQTLFAKITCLLLILLGVYFFRKNTIISVNLKNELWREHLEKQKTEELSLLKNQFFTNVSHELRTPLTLILGPLKQLLAETGHASPLQTIYRNASKLKILVDQIMDISKIENQMMKLNLNHGDIVSHILDSSRNFIEFARQKEILFCFKSSISSCYCNFDSDKMDKILSNILSNAFKSTLKGGKVVIDLDFERQSGNLVLECTDTGKGIHPEEIEHIFDRFFSSSKPSDEYSGTGIGLDLTKKLIELQNGTISVASISGKGSTFKVTIPFPGSKVEFAAFEKILVENSSVKHIAATESVPPEFKHEKRILVIDDNAEMCDFIETILSNQYDVIKEVDAINTFNNIINYMPDLIISDVMMPGINGFELVKQVRNDVRFSHIPIILLTAKVTTSDHITGYETGADDYIYKPFDGEILKARIKNLIVQKENLRKHFIGTDGIINSKIKANDLDVKFMDSILNLIKTHYSEPEFNVNDIIKTMGMSRTIFYKKFKALSDQSINDLIRSYRLRKAIGLLSTGGYTVSQAAYECGFSDPAYFSKVFKEYYKMSPKEYTGKQQ
jgi:ligand-binding sensor domain-containing protein/signal transduction histidine kinase/DNA-binding response OmpR family regulator